MAKAGRSKTRQAGRGGRASNKRPGLPDPRSILEVTTFTSPAGKTYRVLHTSERDPYDKPPPRRTTKHR